MSTFAYAQITNTREASPPGTSATTGNPGIKTYVDAFAALVPAEVLTLHALVISVTTEQTTGSGGLGAMATVILPEAAGTLRIAFWVLVVMSIALFAAPRYFGGKWDKFD